VKLSIDLDKLARLQTASDMRLYRLRGLQGQILDASRNAAVEFERAIRGAHAVFQTTDAIETVIATLTAEFEGMRSNGGFTPLALSAAAARIEAARRCAVHRARVASLVAERDRLEPTYHAQGSLLRKLNTFAEVRE
jgi:hypothetical protein